MGALALLGAAPADRRPEPKDALERLARQVAIAVEERSPEAPIALDVRAQAPELERAFATLLAAELSAGGLPAVPVRAPSAEAAEPAARDSGARALVRVTLSLEHGLLQARGDVLGTWVNFWAGRAPTRPPKPAGAIVQSTEADARALTLAAQPLPLPPAVPVALPPGKLQLAGALLARLPLPTAALATGDLDGDGVDEVLVLTDEELIAFAPDGRVLARRDARALPPSPTPSREPAGAIAVYSNPTRVAYASARRARGEVLEYDKANHAFRPLGQLELAPLGAGELVLSAAFLPGQSTFAPEVAIAGKGTVSAGGPFLALSAVPTPAGGDAVVVYPNGAGARLNVQPPNAAAEPLSGLGAGTALVDLDGDGRPELATSSPLFAPEPDEVRVLDAAGKTVLFQAPVHGRVLQLAGIALEKDKPRGLVLGVWLPDGSSEVQLFRRVSP